MIVPNFAERKTTAQMAEESEQHAENPFLCVNKMTRLWNISHNGQPFYKQTKNG